MEQKREHLKATTGGRTAMAYRNTKPSQSHQQNDKNKSVDLRIQNFIANDKSPDNYLSMLSPRCSNVKAAGHFNSKSISSAKSRTKLSSRNISCTKKLPPIKPRSNKTSSKTVDQFRTSQKFGKATPKVVITGTSERILSQGRK